MREYCETLKKSCECDDTTLTYKPVNLLSREGYLTFEVLLSYTSQKKNKQTLP